MNHYCAACGHEVTGGIALGGVILCRTCEADVSLEIDDLREAGKPVNVGHIARKMYRDKGDLASYLLRDFPGDLLTQVKQRALTDKCSQRDVIMAAIRQYVA
jgi:translation initiation factor 2 beta subunit (eIF-2beta)/eIF-5